MDPKRPKEIAKIENECCHAQRHAAKQFGENVCGNEGQFHFELDLTKPLVFNSFETANLYETPTNKGIIKHTILLRQSSPNSLLLGGKHI